MATTKKRLRSKSIRARVSTSSPKRSQYLKKLSSWYESAPDKSKRLATERRFREGIKLVRRIYSGFDAVRGFDMRHLRHWPDSRVELLKRFISEANRLTHGEYHTLYKLEKPRTVDQAAALRLHTGQESPDSQRHPQQRWVVYANVRKARVRYVRDRVPVGAAMGRPIFRDILRAEVRQPVRGGALVHRDYLFTEVLGFQPGLDSTTPEGMRVGRLLKTFDPWEQMVKAMRALVKRLPDRTPQGNEAHYRLLSDRGPISTSVPKHMLVQRMQRWGDDYDPRFAGMLLGVRYQGDEFSSKRLDSKSEQRQAKYRRFALERHRARSRISYTGHLHPSPKKKKSAKRSKLKPAVRKK